MAEFIPSSLGEAVVWFIILTLGAMGKQIVSGIITLATGKQAEERSLLGQYRTEAIEARREVDEARRERDSADVHRRQIAEHASELRFRLLSEGVAASDIPPFPTREVPERILRPTEGDSK